MTVAELIEALKQRDQSALVVVDLRDGDKFFIGQVMKVTHGGIGSFSDNPIVALESRTNEKT